MNNSNTDINETIKKIRNYFEEEELKKESSLENFSNDVITVAYQKLCQKLEDDIQNEEDTMLLNEMLRHFLETARMVEERGLAKKNLLLKLLDQLTKYEQSRYY